MTSLISLAEPDSLLVADASVIINLIATGCAAEILRALPNPIAVTDVVPIELATGKSKGRRDAELLAEQVSVGSITIVSLDDVANVHFESLVVGPASTTLDDGEAATIAYAAANTAMPVIDERKAIRICADSFPSLRIACSIDILAHDAVGQALGATRLAQAVVNALQVARMRVLPHHQAWVVDLIGPEKAALCSSLPMKIRSTAR